MFALQFLMGLLFKVTGNGVSQTSSSFAALSIFMTLLVIGFVVVCQWVGVVCVHFRANITTRNLNWKQRSQANSVTASAVNTATDPSLRFESNFSGTASGPGFVSGTMARSTGVSSISTLTGSEMALPVPVAATPSLNLPDVEAPFIIDNALALAAVTVSNRLSSNMRLAQAATVTASASASANLTPAPPLALAASAFSESKSPGC